MCRAILMNELGEFDVVAAVLGDFGELPFAKPLNRLKAFTGFFQAKGGVGDGIKGQTVFEFFRNHRQHIQSGELAEVKHRVAVQYFVVESDDVETDHEIRALKFTEEVINLFFGVNRVTTSGR